ncbi:MAG: hypothetical protein ABIZ91_18075 [Gemmatimonadaceae bacterium]
MPVSVPRPFFTAPLDDDGAAAVSRRLLLVSVAYPPNAEVGSLRWQKLAQAARARGIVTDVIMVDPLDPSLREESRLSEVPAGARLYDVPMRDLPIQKAQRAVRGVARRLRGATAPSRERDANGGTGGGDGGGIDNITHSDSVAARLGRTYRAWAHYAEWEEWASRVAALGARIAAQTEYAAVVSSGPPHIAHEAARRIAESASLPLVIDLRDPWFSDDMEPPLMRGNVWRRKTSRYERQCVKRAALVVVNTDSSRDDLVARYAADADRILTVMNGADADVTPGHSTERRFIISHAGSLYRGRDPRSLFQGVARAVEKLGLTRNELLVHFMGSTTYEETPLSQIASEEGIADLFVCEPRRPRAEALALIQDSAMVTVLPQGYVHSIPGKVFEYVQLSTWPLVLTDRGTATDRLLHGSGADVLLPDDVAGIAEAIERRYLAFRAGVRPAPINADGRFNRDRQAAKLLDVIERLV